MVRCPYLEFIREREYLDVLENIMRITSKASKYACKSMENGDKKDFIKTKP